MKNHDKRMIAALEGVVKAQRELLSWYKEEMERSQFEDDEVPIFLQEYEQALDDANIELEAAKGKKP